MKKAQLGAESTASHIPAVSSGGGSALFPLGASVCKLKRCGLADRGFVDESFDSYSAGQVDADVFEFTEHLLGGLMSLPAAIAECRMTALLAAEGLCAAYAPRGLIVITDLPGSPYQGISIGAAVSEITSDLRIDEFVCMALSPLLAELFERKWLMYDPQSGFFRAEGVPLTLLLHRWRHLFDVLEQIGRSVGGFYRRVHDAGYVRGAGSAWFGNEVIDRSGELSLVDFDGGTDLARGLSPEFAERLRRLELNQYASESFTFLTEMRPRVLSCFGASFCDGFRAGYDLAAYRPIPADLLREVIDAHLRVLPIVERGFGFPVPAVADSP